MKKLLLIILTFLLLTACGYDGENTQGSFMDEEYEGNDVYVVHPDGKFRFCDYDGIVTLVVKTTDNKQDNLLSHTDYLVEVGDATYASSPEGYCVINELDNTAQILINDEKNIRSADASVTYISSFDEFSKETREYFGEMEKYRAAQENYNYGKEYVKDLDGKIRPYKASFQYKAIDGSIKLIDGFLGFLNEITGGKKLNPEWYPIGLWRDDVYAGGPDGKFNIRKYPDGNYLIVYRDDNLSDTLLNYVNDFKIKDDKLYVYSKAGYCIVDEIENTALIFISDEELNDRNHSEDNAVTYLPSYAEFSDEEQRIFEKMAEYWVGREEHRYGTNYVVTPDGETKSFDGDSSLYLH